MALDHRLNLTRESDRRTADDTLREQLEFIARRALAGNRGRGWGYEIGPISARRHDLDGGSSRWLFESAIRFYRKTEIPLDRFTSQLRDIIEWASAAGHNSRFARCPWIAEVEKRTQEVVNQDQSQDSSNLDDDLSYVPLSEVDVISKGTYFNHLYGLDSQIAILLSSLQAAADSKMSNRFHSLLWGDPGCGKTEILQSTAKLLRKLGVNFLILDATSTTEAGMRKSLLDDDVTTPDVILIEEIEKVVESSLRWLLGIMDVRATISQANYRKTASRRVPAIVLATANDIDQLKKMMYGALHSRFQHEIHCPRPDRKVLAMILEREVRKINGRKEWIEPALTFCYDSYQITDPRKIVPICLCGKDQLITGEYQKHLEVTMVRNLNEHTATGD